MIYRTLIAMLATSILAACAGHTVPNRNEIAELINRQLISIDVGKQKLDMLDKDSVTNLECTGDGMIAFCKFDVSGRNFSQVFGHSKHGWTGRSSAFYAQR